MHPWCFICSISSVGDWSGGSGWYRVAYCGSVFAPEFGGGRFWEEVVPDLSRMRSSEDEVHCDVGGGVPFWLGMDKCFTRCMGFFVGKWRFALLGAGVVSVAVGFSVCYVGGCP